MQGQETQAQQIGTVLALLGVIVPDYDTQEPPAEQVKGEVVGTSPEIDVILNHFDDWMLLDVAEGKSSPETRRSYRGDLRQHLVWLLKRGIAPAGVDEEVLRHYRTWLVERYAATTVGRKLASVRRFYEMAHRRGYLPSNPAAHLRAPKVKTARHERIKYLSADAVRRLLAAPSRTTPEGIRDRAMLVMMALHGLRVIEVHRLNLEDVDLENLRLRVFGKGDKWRTIFLTEATASVLEMWLAARALMKPETQAVFVSLAGVKQGGRISRRAIRKRVDTYLARLGLKKAGISCHSLRHSYGTQAIAHGAALLAVSLSMGHASITTTQVYVDIVDRERANPTKFIEELLIS